MSGAADEVENWTADDFRPHIDEMINQLRAGELFTANGLTEDDAILAHNENAPPRNKKSHKFNVLLEAVAMKLVKENGLEKKAKKNIFKHLHKFSEEWANAIKMNPPKGSPTQHSLQLQPKIEEPELDDDAPVDDADTPTERMEQEHVEDDDEDLQVQDTHNNSGTAVSRPLTEKERLQKGIFERERDEILRDIPEEVKARFGQIMFSKWSNSYLPVLVMNPFKVPPGGVRDLWYSMHDKVKSAGRLDSMTNLVYWYGAYNDPPSAYSFLAVKKLIPYDVGIKKGYDQTPKGKKKVNDQLIRGLEEMKEDLVKEPEDRSGRMGSEFMEVYQLPTDSEDDAEKLAELPPKVAKKRGRKKKTEQAPEQLGDDELAETAGQPKKKKPGRKRKQPVEEEQVEMEATTLKKKKKKKKATIQKQASPEVTIEEQVLAEGQPIAQEVAQEQVIESQVQAPRDGGAPIVHEKDFLPKPIRPATGHSARDQFPEDDYLSHDDENDEEVEPETESDDDDAEFSLHTSKPKAKTTKKKKAERKQPPKKKATKAKVKKKEIEKVEMPTKVKRTASQAKLKKQEQSIFEECEINFLPLICKWEIALQREDAATLDSIYEDVTAIVGEFSAAFIEEYGLPSLIKKSKMVRDTSGRKKLFQCLKDSYVSKKDSKPIGFKPKKMKDKEEVMKEVMEQLAVPASAPQDEDKETGEDHGSDSHSVEDLQAKKESTHIPFEAVEKPPPLENLAEVTASPSIKRSGSLENVSLPDTKETPVNVPAPHEKRETPIKTERKKKFSLGSLMRPASSAPKSASKSNPTKQVSSSAQPSQQKKMPTWISQTSAVSPDDQNRSYALEFFRQAAPFIPQSKYVNYDAVALALEAAVYEWAEGRGNTLWLDKYWEKVHEIVASISGKQEKAGTIASLIAEGRFQSPNEIVQLPDDVYIDSFEGRPVSI
eukprot:CAMPEP_0117006428 /NCGR_PEP_ID=MMETSP0472-20121206/6659_1 /TAXON_ID=693140 ORGANISM="Tiarina fusus, Strain LIS" /NCGR_SAMPLE_ID=MMETSP0472 /ASSEMBLY_ACC=CAM_ASM_000603 /LENGTH=939 /DNA_ID=CAMNT_0004707889 /DNA_START=241 /DNA_END=3060 /DNA_ORIENTATION=-